MNKSKLGAKTFLYPMPTVLLGSKINSQPNFATIAYCGVVQHQPPLIAFGSGKGHRSNEAIRKTKSFSLNLPSTAMMKVTDFCGLSSSATSDKAKLFKVFYGVLGNAPMIEECPLNLECKLVAVLDFGGTNEIFVGEVIESYAEEQYLTRGLPDMQKLDPLLFSMHDNHYWSIGSPLGEAWNVGKTLKPKRKG
jgi:flavin reductase (DIM6/NTAB) family NADH-FMN oxidoreductase RutF